MRTRVCRTRRVVAFQPGNHNYGGPVGAGRQPAVSAGFATRLRALRRKQPPAGSGPGTAGGSGGVTARGLGAAGRLPLAAPIVALGVRPKPHVNQFLLLDGRQAGRHPPTLAPVGPAGINRPRPPKPADAAGLVPGRWLIGHTEGLPRAIQTAHALADAAGSAAGRMGSTGLEPVTSTV